MHELEGQNLSQKQNEKKKKQVEISKPYGNKVLFQCMATREPQFHTSDVLTFDKADLSS